MRNRLLLFPILLLLAYTQTFAQVSNNDRLIKQAAIGYKLQFDANYSQAISKAKEKGFRH